MWASIRSKQILYDVFLNCLHPSEFNAILRVLSELSKEPLNINRIVIAQKPRIVIAIKSLSRYFTLLCIVFILNAKKTFLKKP